jgi:hypothetical protein
MSKRMSIAAIKRSQEIYSSTFDKNVHVHDVIDINIQPEDDDEEIKDNNLTACKKKSPLMKI